MSWLPAAVPVGMSASLRDDGFVQSSAHPQADAKWDNDYVVNLKFKLAVRTSQSALSLLLTPAYPSIARKGTSFITVLRSRLCARMRSMNLSRRKINARSAAPEGQVT